MSPLARVTLVTMSRHTLVTRHESLSSLTITLLSTPGRLQSPPGVPKLQQEVDNISLAGPGWLLLLLMIRHYLNI